MKKYENPMLQVISIKSNDILTNSPVQMGVQGNYDSGTISIGAADRFRDDWDAGY